MEDMREAQQVNKEAQWQSDKDATNCKGCTKEFSISRRRVSCYLSPFFKLFIIIFSSPEPKAQVIFSDQNLSVLRPRSHCRKLFTFSSSSPEPLSQFQPNLAQSILGWRGFKFVQMKCPALIQREIITILRKCIDKF